MTLKRLISGAAAAGALGAGLAFAGITGAPGEAQLVPLFLNSDAGTDTQVETYVALYVPTTMGRDTVFDYTAPHTQGKTQAIPPTQGSNQIYWKVFDKRSKPGPSGTCEISLGDKTVWTTDLGYRAAQNNQDNGLSGMGNPPPTAVCGPGAGLDQAGYVVFQTFDGARGLEAPFAFHGNAWVVENVLAATTPALAAVPVIPMADGADGLPNATPNMGNQVTMTSPLGAALPPATGPYDVRPLAGGIRLSGPVGATNVVVQGELRGPLTGSEQGLHAFWFDQNLDRTIGVNIWDDHQGSCDDGVDLSDELNLILWNSQLTIAAGAGTETWGNLGGVAHNVNQFYTYVLDALDAGPLTPTVDSPPYCEPTFWNAGNVQAGNPGSLNGYVEYILDVEPGHAAVAFQWQEVLAGTVTTPAAQRNVAWSTHLMTDLGKQ